MTTVKASFDVASLAGKMKVLNAKNGASQSIKTLDDKAVINAVGVLQYEETVDTYGNPQQATVTTIFAEDGTAYASISETVAKAASEIIDLVSEFKLETFQVQILKQKSGKGNEFLSVQILG